MLRLASECRGSGVVTPTQHFEWIDLCEMESKRMEAVSNGPSFRMVRSRRVFPVIFVWITTLVMLTASSSATSFQSGSVKAELFHREHPFSRLQLPSSLGHVEKLQNDVRRSAQRAQSLFKRRILGETGESPTNRSTTWETVVTDGAPVEYVMSISLGTPPQNFVAVVDTGSDLTWLQCKPCTKCYSQPSPFYDPKRSSTYQNLSCSSVGAESFSLQYGATFVPSCATSNTAICKYAYSYGDGSNTAGTFSSETLNLQSVSGQIISVPDFWFGCSHTSNSPSALLESTDGIVGLGQGLISLSTQLADVFEGKFSYCLVNRTLIGVQSSLLVFGNDAALDVALQYTPMLCNQAYPFYYYVGIEGITVGGHTVNYSTSALAIDTFGNGGTIIDSGTTFTSLNPIAFEALLAAVDAKLSSYQRVTLSADLAILELCYDVNGRPNYGNDLPEISLKMANNTNWTLDVDNSWLLLPDVPKAGDVTICLAIVRGMQGGISILGNQQQMDFHVLYDRVEKRIGFAKADCGSLSS